MEDGSKQTIDLNGEYHYRVDAKGRLSLPASFRRVLSTELVVSFYPGSQSHPEDVYLNVFQEDDFNRWVDKIIAKRTSGDFDETISDHTRLRRVLKRLAVNVVVDAAGRIMLPTELRERAGIDHDVVVAGNGDRFEVWDVDKFQASVEEIELTSLFL